MSIQEDGNIHLRVRDGIVVVFEFMTSSGLPRDMSAATVTFETQNFVKALVAGDEPHLLVLELATSELPLSYLSKKTKYVIVDSSGQVPHVILEASLVVTGWQ